MKQIFCIAFTVLLAGTVSHPLAVRITGMEDTMTAKGKFEVNLLPQNDEEAPAGRMIINKSYEGDIVGSAAGQMISKRTESGNAVYYAIEEFSGSVKGKSGSFTLIHSGRMSKKTQSLEVEILEGSGSGDLQNISGSMVIAQDANGHIYELNYKL